MLTVGIDIWKKKWLAVVLVDGRYQEGTVKPGIARLLDEWLMLMPWE